MVTTKEILDKYSRKLESQISQEPESGDYLQFKQDMLPEISRYEKWAQSLGNLIRLRVADKDRIRVQKQLDAAHVTVDASQALTLATISMLLIFLATVLAAVSIFLINGSVQILFVFLGLITSMFVFYYTFSMPQRLANAWRLKASSEMVPAILYIVVYMKHTSNLERAVEFAAQHLEGPLALDFKKVFYDVEIGKFSSIKLSLDSYLESWQEYAPEFVESFHLIESSLFEPSETRRVQILEKSLQIILDGVYEKMLKYSREIRSPLTNIYMLGIILPTLGLALLPLASTLLGGVVHWQHVFIIFNVIIPFFVFYLVSEVLLKRPGGYGESSILELNPDYPKYKSKAPFAKAALIAIPLFLIGISPFIFQISAITSTLGIKNDYTLGELGIPFFQAMKLFDFKQVGDNTVGPFSPLGVILSFFIPLSIGFFFSSAYKAKTKDLIKARENTKTLEQEFTNSLFQLGNRLGDGIPAEIAFSKVAESTQGQATHSFFLLTSQNIQQGGMSLEESIFDKKRGSITYYPSSLIATSMRILVESVRKGLQVAARSLMSISDYVKNIDKINQRLKDLLAEVVSDMKSNMTFLAPLLAGIVVGLSVMITTILNQLGTIQGAVAGASGLGGFGNLLDLFKVSEMIPPYFLQGIIGLYIVEIVFILTAALVTVDAGKDTLKEKYEISRNLKTGISLYIITALLATLALTTLATIVLPSLTG
ncbi:hypothetical protein KW787_00535 [Candidatus Pacearchaeota archaeon]|nr:hypothetical protein [Candidatus Pacearchaeota archaeon]